MQRKLTITLDEKVYESLHAVVGRGNISQFLEDLARAHLIGADLQAAYSRMAADGVRESEAEEWGEALLPDAAGADDAPR